MIKPALTPKEWEGLMVTKDGVLIPLRFAHCDHEISREHHRIAAMCLYGQPFGFTQEDVTLLRELAAGQQATLLLNMHPSVWPKDFGEPDRQRVDALADRIAALLPPRNSEATTTESTTSPSLDRSANSDATL